MLKKISLTTIVVPLGQPASSNSISCPPSISYLVPISSFCAFVKSSTLDTADIEAIASPLKPKVPIEFKSSFCEILLVAWETNTFLTSSRSIPHPSSVILIYVEPPFLISRVIFSAPASSEFSIISFTTLEGRSTTSPAAIS